MDGFLTDCPRSLVGCAENIRGQRASGLSRDPLGHAAGTIDRIVEPRFIEPFARLIPAAQVGNREADAKDLATTVAANATRKSECEIRTGRDASHRSSRVSRSAEFTVCVHRAAGMAASTRLRRVARDEDS